MESNTEKATKLLSEAADLLGWQIVIPNDEDVQYIIIGTTEALDKILDKLEV